MESDRLRHRPKGDRIGIAFHGLFDDLPGLGSAIALAPTNTDNGLLTAEEILSQQAAFTLIGESE